MQKIFVTVQNRLKSVLPEKYSGLIEKFVSLEFFTFLAVGVVNTISTTVFATILDIITTELNRNDFVAKYRITFIIGYLLGLVISFFLNTYFTFRQKPTLKKFIKFPISYIPNFIIQYALVWIFTLANFNNTLAYLIAAIIGLPITFLLMKLFVYKK